MQAGRECRVDDPTYASGGQIARCLAPTTTRADSATRRHKPEAVREFYSNIAYEYTPKA